MSALSTYLVRDAHGRIRFPICYACLPALRIHNSCYTRLAAFHIHGSLGIGLPRRVAMAVNRVLLRPTRWMPRCVVDVESSV